MGKMNSFLTILEGGDNAQGTGEMVSDLDFDLTLTLTYLTLTLDGNEEFNPSLPPVGGRQFTG